MREAARLAGGVFWWRRKTGVGKTGLQGTNRAGTWPWGITVARVVHLERWLGSGRLGAACTAKGADQHGGARRRAMLELFWCRLVCAK